MDAKKLRNFEIALIGILTLANACDAHFLNTYSSCGKDLTDILDIVCDGKFNTLGRKAKKSVSNIEDYSNTDLSAIKDDYATNDMSSPTNVGTFLRRLRRSLLTGIQKDCCARSCSVAELLSTCA